jgi:hypothetical protein
MQAISSGPIYNTSNRYESVSGRLKVVAGLAIAV